MLGPDTLIVSWLGYENLPLLWKIVFKVAVNPKSLLLLFFFFFNIVFLAVPHRFQSAGVLAVTEKLLQPISITLHVTSTRCAV